MRVGVQQLAQRVPVAGKADKIQHLAHVSAEHAGVRELSYMNQVHAVIRCHGLNAVRQAGEVSHPVQRLGRVPVVCPAVERERDGGMQPCGFREAVQALRTAQLPVFACLPADFRGLAFVSGHGIVHVAQGHGIVGRLLALNADDGVLFPEADKAERVAKLRASLLPAAGLADMPGLRVHLPDVCGAYRAAGAGNKGIGEVCKALPVGKERFPCSIVSHVFSSLCGRASSRKIPAFSCNCSVQAWIFCVRTAGGVRRPAKNCHLTGMSPCGMQRGKRCMEENMLCLDYSTARCGLQ